MSKYNGSSSGNIRSCSINSGRITRSSRQQKCLEVVLEVNSGGRNNSSSIGRSRSIVRMLFLRLRGSNKS